MILLPVVRCFSMTSKLDTACNGIAIVRIHCRNTFPEKGRKESIAIKIEVNKINGLFIVSLGDYIGPKKNRKFIIIGQIIGSGQIDSFMLTL